MKAKEIIDAVIEVQNRAIEIELPNGHRLTTSRYSYDQNKRGEPVLVIHAGEAKG